MSATITMSSAKVKVAATDISQKMDILKKQGYGTSAMVTRTLITDILWPLLQDVCHGYP